MNWLFWRMYRKQIIFTGLAVLVYAVILFVAGNDIANQYARAKSEHRVDTFFISGPAGTLPMLSIAFPVLLGMFWGAPLLAKEFSENTHKFAWTQGVSRRKWLFTKLGWTVGFAAVFGATISTAVMWCSRTQNALQFNQFNIIYFNTQALMPIAYTIFAVVLGACIGALFRSVLRSLALTMVACIAIVFCVANFVRPHYMTPLVTGSGGDLEPAVNQQTHEIEPGAGRVWILHRDYNRISGECQVVQGFRSCSYGEVAVKTIYQPDDRYWKFQCIEFGLYLVLSALLVGATYRLIQKRDA